MSLKLLWCLYFIRWFNRRHYVCWLVPSWASFKYKSKSRCHLVLWLKKLQQDQSVIIRSCMAWSVCLYSLTENMMTLPCTLYIVPHTLDFMVVITNIFLLELILVTLLNAYFSTAPQGSDFLTLTWLWGVTVLTQGANMWMDRPLFNVTTLNSMQMQ